MTEGSNNRLNHDVFDTNPRNIGPVSVFGLENEVVLAPTSALL